MTLSRTALPKRLQNIGAGPDGVMLKGEVEGRTVVVHRLKGPVLTDPLRRRRLERRIAFERDPNTEALGVERVLLADLASEQAPIIVVDAPRANTWQEALPNLHADLNTGLAVLIHTAQALAAAHAEGIAAGSLDPAALLVTGDTTIVSLLGINTGAPPQRDERWTRRFIVDEPSTAADAAAFGGLCAMLALHDDDDTTQKAAWDFIADPQAAVQTPLTLLIHIARELLDVEPAWRPAMSDVAARLATMQSLVSEADHTKETVAEEIARPRKPEVPTKPTIKQQTDDASQPTKRRLGRFTLNGPLGAGSMGQVWRGTDEDTGEDVAVKIISKDIVASEKAKRRFKKEARLLSELKNPGIARFIESGELDGTLYLATELVDGATLNKHAKERTLNERDAAILVADLTRALIDVHENGIVHRDIKPDNVIVVKDAKKQGTTVKLIDFGVARHLDEQGSLAMTRQGAVLGTPLYMSPEQAKAEAIDARSDLYAIGTVLYELLIGEAPFAGHGITQVLAMQIEHTPQRVRHLRPALSEEIDTVVARCLEKKADHRYQSARDLLAALLPLTGQRETTAPKPPTDARTFIFTFPLLSNCQSLWPFVSNTERLNKAIGISAVEESIGIIDDEVARFGSARQAGLQLTWREHPYEWVYERRLSVLREYSEGPLRSLRSTVELHKEGDGTHLVQTIEVTPRGLMGKAAAAIEIGVRTRRALERTYSRIDGLLQGRRDGRLDYKGERDAFEAAEPLPTEVEARFLFLEKQAVAQGASAQAIDVLGAYLQRAPLQELARIRPLALARERKLPEQPFIDACYIAASVGLLRPLWDLLCPSCRVPSSIEETLRALRTHGRCEACNLEYSLDLASSIELVFQVHPSLRRADAQSYCLSSPAHTPHVVVQLRVPVGERVTVDTSLPEGHYQVLCRGTTLSQPLRVRASDNDTKASERLDVALGQEPSLLVRVLPPTSQQLSFINDTDRVQLVRVERSTPRDDVLTAMRALSSSLFKRLFPGEVLQEGALLRVADVTMVLIEPSDRSSPLGLERLYGVFRKIDAIIAEHGGSVVRLHGEGVLASFNDPVSAAHAVVAVSRGIADTAHMRAGIHRAACGAVTLNSRLDYFGAAVIEVVALVARASADEVLVSDAIAADPGVQAALNGLTMLAATLDDGGIRRRFSVAGSGAAHAVEPSAVASE